MKCLQVIVPTSEQLAIIANARPGLVLIRGAAGSGKTTTALLQLKQLVAAWRSRRERAGSNEPVRVLVITFNRTLSGYISEIASAQVPDSANVELEISTFSKWALRIAGSPSIIDYEARAVYLRGRCGKLPTLPAPFVLDEVDYALGRFLPSRIDEYLGCQREGRGTKPRLDRASRAALVEEVIRPYWKWKGDAFDFNDLAVAVSEMVDPEKYDIIVADETQDFSANEIRALANVAANPSSMTFVIDAAQRIYARGFPWKETGLVVPAGNTFRLKTNHRNTAEIAAFAAPLLSGLTLDEDATLPDLTATKRHGPKPAVLVGTYTGQVNEALARLGKIDTTNETVAFLKPRGGKWFSTLKGALKTAGIGYEELTKKSDWPGGSTNVALCSMCSAKGLEFDHVFILGLNDEVTPHDDDPEDSDANTLRRLLAMAVMRARRSVLVGYKPGEASKLIAHLSPTTFDKVLV